MWSVKQIFHAGNVVQNRRGVLSFAWHEWFSCKGKEWKIYCCDLVLSSEPQIWKFHVVVRQTPSKHCTKKRAARAARLFFLFNQSNHRFVLSLPLSSSFLKLLIKSRRNTQILLSSQEQQEGSPYGEIPWTDSALKLTKFRQSDEHWKAGVSFSLGQFCSSSVPSKGVARGGPGVPVIPPFASLF